MQLKSHSQDKKNSNANSLSMVSEKISREMINFNIWDDRIPFIVKWTQMDLKSRLLLGQRLDFHACDRSDMPAVTFTPAILTAFFSLHWFTVASPPLPVHWYLTPLTPSVLELYLQNNKPLELHMYNIFTFMIHVSIPLVCLSFSPAKSLPHLLLDTNRTSKASRNNLDWNWWYINISYALRAILISLAQELKSSFQQWGR